MKKSKIQLRQSMGNNAKKHHNKFDPDTKRNDGALGFFQRASPPKNNNKKKISIVWGPVPGPKTMQWQLVNEIACECSHPFSS